MTYGIPSAPTGGHLSRRGTKTFLAATAGVVPDVSAEAVREQLTESNRANYHEPGSLDAPTTILADVLTG